MKAHYAFHRELGKNIQLVQYEIASTDEKVLTALDALAHTIEYSSMALGGISSRVKIATKIVWSKPHGNAEHWDTIVKNVKKMARQGNREMIYTNRSVGVGTGRKYVGLRRPDIIAERDDGIFDIIEVLSPTQTVEDLEEKGEYYKAIFGNKMKYRILRIGEMIEE